MWIIYHVSIFISTFIPYVPVFKSSVTASKNLHQREKQKPAQPVGALE
jgi:hypothetical protein